MWRGARVRSGHPSACTRAPMGRSRCWSPPGIRSGWTNRVREGSCWPVSQGSWPPRSVCGALPRGRRERRTRSSLRFRASFATGGRCTWRERSFCWRPPWRCGCTSFRRRMRRIRHGWRSGSWCGARDRNVTHGSVLRADPAVTIGDIMVPLREWLRPPKSLLLILVLLSLVSVSTVGWFGFKLLEQDRMVQAQGRQDRLEQAADRMAATLRGAPAVDAGGNRRAAERVAHHAAARGQTRRWGAAHRGRELGDGVSRGAVALLPGALPRAGSAGRGFCRGRAFGVLAATAGQGCRCLPRAGRIEECRNAGGSAAAIGARTGQVGTARSKPRGVHAPGGDWRRASGGSAGRTGGASRTRGWLAARGSAAWALAPDARAVRVLLRTRGAGRPASAGGSRGAGLERDGRTRADHGVGGRASVLCDVADGRRAARRAGGDAEASRRGTGGLRGGG